MREVAVLFARADSIPRLRELFAYEPDTGRLRRRKSGDIVGTRNAQGYVVVSADSRLLYVHRIAWAIQTGAWPIAEIDHINGRRDDNSWHNLRDVARRANVQNRHGADRDSGTGLLGAFKDGSRFVSKIRANGVLHRLGRFDTAAEAHTAYLAAKRRLHEGCTL